MTSHRPIVVPIRRGPHLLDKYRPSCPCGDNGGLFADIADAQAWARNHARETEYVHVVENPRDESPPVLRRPHVDRHGVRTWVEK